MRVLLLHISPQGLISLAASRSRGRQTNSTALIDKLIQLGHHSPLEHATATFLISGISRSCADQLLRHRLLSATVESQRHVDLSEHNFVTPQTISQDPEAFQIFHQTVEACRAAYQKLLALGIPKEDARYLIPIGVETSLVVTANFREWRHILRTRLSEESQWEIRELASRILEVLKEEAPHAFADLP